MVPPRTSLHWFHIQYCILTQICVHSYWVSNQDYLTVEKYYYSTQHLINLSFNSMHPDDRAYIHG